MKSLLHLLVGFCVAVFLMSTFTARICDGTRKGESRKDESGGTVRAEREGGENQRAVNDQSAFRQ